MALEYPFALSPQRYREVLGQDYSRLRSLVERAGTNPVPSCPGWTAADAARHTALVYQHKVRCIRTGRGPQDWPPPELVELPASDALDQAWAALTAVFDEHEPDDPAYTWWPPDQTVGFWIRRMAHETSIHRRDLESAVQEGTPVASDLALDGIDEVLELFLSGDWEDEAVASASGRSVRVSSAGHAWQIRLDPQIVGFARIPDEGSTNEGAAPPDPAATVSGEPNDVLLWLWGRGPLPDLVGDPDAATELRARLALATA